MRVLVVGATGMIGSRLVEALAAAGHAVACGVRDVARAKARWPGRDAIALDLAALAHAPPPPGLLHGIDAVVNTVGIFRETPGQSFETLHVRGPAALFRSAAAAGVRVVHLSALGADAGSEVGYLSSKGRADELLQALPGAHTVVRPSLVFAPEGASTGWFAQLAALPLTPLPGGGAQCIQPVHVDDLCAAIVRLLALSDPPRILHAVGPEAMTLRAYLAQFKRALGFAQRFVAVPMRWVHAFASLGFGAWVGSDAMRMLEMGNTADPRPFATVLGRAARPAAAFITASQRGAMRAQARLAWWLPLLRNAVVAMWLVTAYVSAFVFPKEASLALLARTGLHGLVAEVALYGAAALDAVLGLLALAPRSRRFAYRAQFVLIAFYTLVISIALPEYWVHPYGPVLKNLPLLAAIAVLHELDTDGTADR